MAYPPATLGAQGWTVPNISGGIARFSADGSSLVDKDGNFFNNSISVSARPGEFLDVVLSAAIATVRLIAALNRGRCPVIRLRGGNYFLSATDVTITLEPWMRIACDGNVRVVATGHTVPLFWLRNDGSPQFPQGIDAENNNGFVIDGSNGVVLIEGNKSSGGAAVRVGNGDGNWGTNYTGDGSFITFLSRFSGMNISGMDHALQFTNNSCFCMRFSDIRATGCNKGIVTSTGAATNSFEISTFTDCFLNNMALLNVEMNSAHQFGFMGCSLTYCSGGNIDINADRARLHFTQGRIENGDYITKSNGAFPRAIVQLENMTITPTMQSAGLLTHLRKLFQGQHVVQMSNVMFDLTSTTPYGVTYSATSMQYLGDATTEISWQNIRALFPASSPVQRQPMPTRQSLVPNGGFVGNITGWTKLSGSGTIAYSTAQANSGAGSILCSITAAQHRLESTSFPVQPGRRYYADCAMFLKSSPAPSAPFYANLRFNWYALDNTTLLSSSTYNVVGNMANYPDQWILPQAGTGLCEAPAGAAYGRVEFATSASMTGDYHLDDVMAVELC